MKFKLILLFFIIPHFIYSQKGSFCIDMQAHNIKKGEGQRALILENSTWAMNYNTNKWVFYVKFLDGSYRNKELVKEFAKEWEKYGNIQFVFVERNSTKYSHIRISFNEEISWSYIGIQSVKIKKPHEPSMMLGWTNETELKEIKRLVLHEFGHALGLLHSHSTKDKPFQWNKDYVYSYLRNYVGWYIPEINDNIFAVYNNDISLSSNSAPYDKYSIMSYFIPKEFTLNGYTSPVNYELSEGDKLAIAKMYPNSDGISSVSYACDTYNQKSKSPIIKEPKKTDNDYTYYNGFLNIGYSYALHNNSIISENLHTVISDVRHIQSFQLGVGLSAEFSNSIYEPYVKLNAISTKSIKFSHFIAPYQENNRGANAFIVGLQPEIGLSIKIDGVGGYWSVRASSSFYYPYSKSITYYTDEKDYIFETSDMITKSSIDGKGFSFNFGVGIGEMSSLFLNYNYDLAPFFNNQVTITKSNNTGYLNITLRRYFDD